jgi:hypothetical protein
MDIKDLEQFSPSATNVFTTDRGYRQYKRNPTSVERSCGIYVPIYTLYRRYRNSVDISLNIQFSIPKLLYGNNFQEVDEEDFEEIVDILYSKMVYNGFNIAKERLINSKVVAIHFSKNILLEKGLNCPMVINELHKSLDTNHKQDFSQVQFKNGGQIVHIHTKSCEFAIYDKVKELQQGKISKHKTVDKQPYVQLNILEEIPANNYLRLEFRITGQKAIKGKIKAYGPNSKDLPLTFRNLYNKELSQTMLQNFWKEKVRERYINITWKPEDFFDKVLSIKSNNPHLTERELILISFMQGMISSKGIQSLRSVMGWEGTKGYKWSKYKKLLKGLKTEDNRLYIIKDIDKQLSNFNMFKIIPKEIQSLVI